VGTCPLLDTRRPAGFVGEYRHSTAGAMFHVQQGHPPSFPNQLPTAGSPNTCHWRSRPMVTPTLIPAGHSRSGCLVTSPRSLWRLRRTFLRAKARTVRRCRSVRRSSRKESCTPWIPASWSGVPVPR